MNIISYFNIILSLVIMLRGDFMKEDNRKIVVYYSYTGHTRMISEKIKEKLNCDIL